MAALKCREMPRDPDFGLLFQDPPGAQERINEPPAEYVRQVTLDTRDAYKITRAQWQSFAC